MFENYDIIIVGSGPAGVSTAFPLVEQGMKVLMLDADKGRSLDLPDKPYLKSRFEDPEQWRWMLGEDYHSLKNKDAVSPKLRAPTHVSVFENYGQVNKIDVKDFVAVGSLAKGGLSRAWGGGVACLNEKELQPYPFSLDDIRPSYAAVANRIGISGAIDDDLSDFFNLDAWAQPPIAMDDMHQSLYRRYGRKKVSLQKMGFKLGRSRITVLSRDGAERKACDAYGNCLWGCSRKAIYTSAYEISSLKKYPNFQYFSDFVVDRVVSRNDSLKGVCGIFKGQQTEMWAKKIVLAAGTLATTRIALQALEIYERIPLLSCPIAAFLVWVPSMFGAGRERSFGLGQLSYSVALQSGISGFGSTFSTIGIPVTEFLNYLPVRKRHGIDLLKVLLPSCCVGNLFLPGHLSTASLALSQDNRLLITGAQTSHKTKELMSEAANLLRKAYWKIGGLLLPMSFTMGRTGSDIHYAGTLPMKEKPVPGQTNVDGELAGLPNIYVTDGACLSTQNEKSHTLTIMANADRIGRRLVNIIRQDSY